MNDDERWLYEGGPPPDEASARLEAALRPLALRADATPPAPPAAAGRGAGAFPPRFLAFAIAAAVAAVAVGATLFLARTGPSDLPSAPTDPEVAVAPIPKPPPAEPPAPVSCESGACPVLADGSAVVEGAWIEAAERGRRIEMPNAGEVWLGAGGRLRLDRSREAGTSLFLDRGEIEARIGAHVKPRWFQVATAAANCVDLGCRYTLKVAADGSSTVRVRTGQVEFEAGGQRKYVPAGAYCVARPGQGPGTPRFENAPASLAEAVDAFDAAAKEPAAARETLATKVLEKVESPTDTLVAWHLLQDPDDSIAVRAEQHLIRSAGAPYNSVCRATNTRPCEKDVERWREHLARSW